MPDPAFDGFDAQVVAILPKLYAQAIFLTRDRTAADDLVQDAVCNAISAQASFIPGSDFLAWMRRILRNRFLTDVHKRRSMANIIDVPEAMLSTKSSHEDGLVLKELDRSIDLLPSDQRQALMLSAMHGMSYEEIAQITGVAIGTAKSRVFRARRQLEIWLAGREVALTKAQGVSGKARTERRVRLI